MLRLMPLVMLCQICWGKRQKRVRGGNTQWMRHISHVLMQYSLRLRMMTGSMRKIGKKQILY